MRTSVRIACAALAAAGLSSVAAPAFADSIKDEGVNAIDDNNASVLPIQACNDNVAAAVGIIIPVLSPADAHCTNAPVVDHPVAGG